jgi:arylsulfatase A-like enzyme
MSDSVPPPAEAADTILVLSVDSLRRDRVHAEREGVPLTPNLDALAEHSIEFADGVSPGPGTADSVPAMVTGGYPSQFPGFSLPPAGTEPLTLAEHLSDRGFRTAAFNQNNLISRRYNFDRGFDFYYDISEETREEAGRGTWRLRVRKLIEDTPLMGVARAAQTLLMEKFGKSLYVLDEPGDGLTDRALEWLDETGGRRFLWMHYMDTHHPYLSSEEVQDAFGRRLPEEEILKLSRKARSDGESLTDREVRDLEYAYDCSVRFVDEQIGRLVDFLAAEGELGDALVVVTADHGEEFLEHGEFGHRDALWDELIRVPLIARYSQAGSADVDGQAAVRAMVETVVDGAGWFDNLDDGEEYVVAETSAGRDGVRCCRGRKYKLIVDGDDRTVTRIADDGEEVVPESDVPAAVVDAMEAELAKTYDEYGDGEPIDEAELQEDLAALGYLED